MIHQLSIMSRTIHFKFQVRIPREHMLSRWGEIDDRGRLIMKGSPVMSYNTLIGERVYAVLGCGMAVSKA